jgi:hypothetical protein
MTVQFAQIHADEVQLPVAHAPLGNNLLRKLTDLAYRPFNYHGLNALIMVEMCMHGRYSVANDSAKYHVPLHFVLRSRVP